MTGVRLTERTPFVVLGDDWGRHVSTTQHLMRQVAQQHPIVWVNSYGHRTPRFTITDAKRAAVKVGRMLRRSTVVVPSFAISENAPAVIIEPKALPWHRRRLIHRLNTTSILRDIRRALASLPEAKAPVFISCSPLGCDMVGALGEQASLYLCIDDFNELPGVERDLLAPFERRLVAGVDGTVVTAQALLDGRVPRSGLSLHLPQGVNFAHFAAQRECPAELRNLPRPIIGFAGGVGPVLDWDLLRDVAAAFPTATLLFVGMLQPDLDVVGMPTNVRFLGARPYSDLPSYVQQFDVALIPYVINRHTISVDPLKLLEYLAAGRSVVSTPLPEVEKYRDHVAIARNTAAFIAAIHFALSNETPELIDSRRHVASEHTWAHRRDSFLTFVERVVSAKQQRSAAL